VKTVQQLQDEIRQDIWPSGEAENLLIPHDHIFQEAFSEIAKWVEGEQSNNCDVIHPCKTFFKCGMTILTAPRGVIRRVYTVVNGDYCDPVFYSQAPWPEPECWSRNFMNAQTVDADVARLPLGFRPFDASMDGDFTRSRSGIWTLHQGNIYLAPWIQSNEFVVIEWSGIKENWALTDLVNPAQDYKKAVKLYLQYGHARDYGEMAMAERIHNIAKSGTYDEALGDLMYQDRKQLLGEAEMPCASERARFPSELSDDVQPVEGEEITGMVVAHLGGLSLEETGGLVQVQRSPDDTGGVLTVVNHGSSSFACNRFSWQNGVGGPSVGSGTIAAGNTDSAFSIVVGSPSNPWTLTLDGVVVASGTYFHGYDWTYTIAAGSNSKIEDIAELVNTFDADLILGVDLITTGTYDDTVGLGFHDFLKPYSGAHGDEGDKNRFWPAIADSDYAAQTSLANYLAFFPIPDGAKYYTIHRGSVQFFFIDTNAANEADGIMDTSVQALWLKAELLRSVADWKVVVMFKNPYSSATSGALATVRWPFRNWGAHLVLSSGTHNYERLTVNHLPYIVNGLATRSGEDTNASPDANSKLFYNTGPGAGKLTANSRQLEYEFIALDGTVIDSLTLTK
jgi:hypothetical protein